MIGGRAAGLLAFAGMAASGAALGWLAERRVVTPPHLADDPEWEELRRPLGGRTRLVDSFDHTVLLAEEAGPPDAPALLLVHGFGLSLRVWHYQRRDLAGEFRVLSYDQRGHAGSGLAANGDYSVDALGRDLAAVLDALVPADRRAVVVGHSLGGMALLAYARLLPSAVAGRLAGVVLLDTTGSDTFAGGVVGSSVAAVSAVQRSLFDAGARLLRRESPERTVISPSDLSALLTRAVGFGSRASPAQVAFVEQLLLDCPNTVKAELGPVLSSLDLRAAAPLLTVPALVLVGAEDRLTPPATARRLAAALPDAELVVLPRTGHNAMIEAHAAVTEHIAVFARGVLARAA